MPGMCDFSRNIFFEAQIRFSPILEVGTPSAIRTHDFVQVDAMCVKE